MHIRNRRVSHSPLALRVMGQVKRDEKRLERVRGKRLYAH